ncbi:MAG TPA: DUF58 domain-containing protein [Methylomirabilota bacterium]|jgi:uncharacterized protein (DUF58 family)
MFALPQGLRPRRTIQPTREGWWCLLAAVGLGLAAINSGNNLLYLLESALLGLVIISGILSEQSMRKLALAPLVPEEIYAGRPALLGARVVNTKRRLPARSIVLEVLGAARRLPLPRLGPGGERVVTWEHTFSARGRQRLGGVRVTTRFPFGLFVKAGPRQLETEVLVFPTVEPVSLERTGPAPGEEAAPVRRRGRGADLYNLREYRDGDDPRLIHWRVSARTGTTMVRELQADSTTDVRIILRGTGAENPARLERGLSRAASLAVHCLRAGVALSVSGPGVHVPRGRGREHERRILTTLALYDPANLGATTGADTDPPRRQLIVDLD